jgi:hypothetical protein
MGNPYKLGAWLKLWRAAANGEPGKKVLQESVLVRIFRTELSATEGQVVLVAKSRDDRLFRGAGYEESSSMFWFYFGRRMSTDEIIQAHTRGGIPRISGWPDYRMPDMIPGEGSSWTEPRVLYSQHCDWKLWRNPDGSPALPEGANFCEEHERGFFELHCPICKPALKLSGQAPQKSEEAPTN